jgi:hypothetical protein
MQLLECLATQTVITSPSLLVTLSRSPERSEGVVKSLTALRTDSAKQSHHCFNRLLPPINRGRNDN